MSNCAGFLQIMGNRLPQANAEALAEAEDRLPDGIGWRTNPGARAGNRWTWELRRRHSVARSALFSDYDASI